MPRSGPIHEILRGNASHAPGPSATKTSHVSIKASGPLQVMLRSKSAAGLTCTEVGCAAVGCAEWIC